jgi:hypothetical protein
MSRHPRRKEASDAGRYLRDSEGHFFFDATSGIYKPKTHVTNNESDRDTKEINRFRITTVISVLTLLAVAIYAYYAALQWCEMQRAADAAKSAAETAGQSLVDSRKSFEVENRPHVIIDGTAYFLKDDKGNTTLRTANVNYKNVGRTPAQSVFIFARYTSIRFHRQKVTQQEFIAKIEGVFQPIIDDDAKSKSTDIYQQLDKTDAAPGAPSVFISRDIVGEPLSDKDLPEIQDGDVTLFYFGRINYKGFEREKSYSSDFCFYFFGKDTTTWHFCPVHNVLN